MPVVHGFANTNRADVQIDISPAKRKQLSNSQSSQHQQPRDRTRRLIQLRGQVSYLDGSEDHSVRSLLASWKFGLLSQVLVDEAPFFCCAKNLAQATLEVVDRLP